MIAYHGKQEIKDQYLARVEAHRIADELIKGKYWEDGKGCAVGCTIHGSDHSRYEIELGIPTILARLEDAIFENLPNGKSKAWPERFLSAIKPGADLSMVWNRWVTWLLSDAEHGTMRLCDEAGAKATGTVIDLYQDELAGIHVPLSAWAPAEAAAWAARGAAWVAAGGAHYIRMSDKLIEILEATDV